MGSNAFGTEPLAVLNRAVATDFPPRRTGIPVRPSDVAVWSVLAAPMVLDEGFFIADNLDGVVAVDVLLS